MSIVKALVRKGERNEYHGWQLDREHIRNFENGVVGRDVELDHRGSVMVTGRGRDNFVRTVRYARRNFQFHQLSTADSSQPTVNTIR